MTHQDQITAFRVDAELERLVTKIIRCFDAEYDGPIDKASRDRGITPAIDGWTAFRYVTKSN